MKIKWAELATEQSNPATSDIDEVSTLDMLAMINREDAQVPAAVQRQLPAIATAVDMVACALQAGGRLFYVGAGTSGRLGILDAAECPPTFGTDADLVQALIAGGPQAIFRAVEDIEDQSEAGERDLRERTLTSNDVVVGIAASGVTAYVLGALRYASKESCETALITCSPNAALELETTVRIVLEVGPEVLSGSTRMKAGTATKMVLNMISTGAMIRVGKTFGNLMVDLQPNNRKLRDRSIRILATIGALAPTDATEKLEAADGNLKTALVMVLGHLGKKEAQAALAASGGIVKQAIGRQSVVAEKEKRGMP